MQSPDNEGHFPATHWTLISRLRSDDATVARRALEDLCTQYHYPLYCFIRRRGLSHHDAQDKLHDFLVMLLSRGSLEELRQEKGRLRGYLGTAVRRFLIDAYRRQSRQPHELPMDLAESLGLLETRYLGERIFDEETPEKLFDRKWSQELMRRALVDLRAMYAAKGRGPLFEALRPVLLDGGSLRGHNVGELAAGVGLSDGALRTALFRLLADYRTVLRGEVLQTVENPDEVDEEIRHLLEVFR